MFNFKSWHQFTDGTEFPPNRSITASLSKLICFGNILRSRHGRNGKHLANQKSCCSMHNSIHHCFLLFPRKLHCLLIASLCTPCPIFIMDVTKQHGNFIREHKVLCKIFQQMRSLLHIQTYASFTVAVNSGQFQLGKKSLWQVCLRKETVGHSQKLLIIPDSLFYIL